MAKEINTTESKKEKKKSESNLNEGHRQRLKERLKKDPAQIPDYEIMELFLGLGLLRKDTKPLAKELLEHFGSIKGCLTAKQAELESFNGFGPNLYNLFLLQQEILVRYTMGTIKEKKQIETLKDMADIAYTRLAPKSTEEVWLVAVDTQNRIISYDFVAKGDIDNVSVKARQIVAIALLRDASGIFLMHNHPGGNYEPSIRDIEFTKDFIPVAEKMGIRFLEHLIVTDKGCVCMLAQTFIDA